PAFVLAASGGRTAADRAVEAQRRLNEAVLVLSTGGLNFEVRTPDTTPALALAGRPELLLEVTEDDAPAYNEDWTGLRGRGVAVAPAAVGAAPLHLEGTWAGKEIEEGLRRDVTATFKADSGSVAYEGMVTLTVPLLSLEAPQNNTVRFSLQYRGGIRYYNGR